MHLQSYVPNHAPQSLRSCHCDTHQESSAEAVEEYCSPLSPTSLPWILWQQSDLPLFVLPCLICGSEEFTRRLSEYLQIGQSAVNSVVLFLT